MMNIKKILKASAFYIFNSFITNVPFYFIRHEYLKKILKIKIGRNTAVHMGCFFSGTQVTIGNNSVLNRRCYVDGRAEVIIGDNVSISPEVYILSLDHNVQSNNFSTTPEKTVINDYTWIGVRSIILPGIELSKGSVVGAGSVVTRNTNQFEIVAGNPAKKINERTKNLTYQINYFPLFDTDEM